MAGQAPVGYPPSGQRSKDPFTLLVLTFTIRGAAVILHKYVYSDFAHSADLAIILLVLFYVSHYVGGIFERSAAVSLAANSLALAFDIGTITALNLFVRTLVTTFSSSLRNALTLLIHALPLPLFVHKFISVILALLPVNVTAQRLIAPSIFIDVLCAGFTIFCNTGIRETMDAFIVQAPRPSHFPAAQLCSLWEAAGLVWSGRALIFFLGSSQWVLCRSGLWLIAKVAVWSGLSPLTGTLYSVAGLFVFTYVSGKTTGPTISTFLTIVFYLLCVHLLQLASIDLLKGLGRTALDSPSSIIPPSYRSDPNLRRSLSAYLDSNSYSRVTRILLFHSIRYSTMGPLERIISLMSSCLTSLIRMIKSAPLQPGQAHPPRTAVDQACHCFCRVLRVPYGQFGSYCFTLIVTYRVFMHKPFLFRPLVTLDPTYLFFLSYIIIEAFDRHTLRIGPLYQPRTPHSRESRELYHSMMLFFAWGCMASSLSPAVEQIFSAAMAEVRPSDADGPWVAILSLMIAYRVLSDLGSRMLTQDLQTAELMRSLEMPSVSQEGKVRCSDLEAT